MQRTIQELREERGESRSDLATAIGATLNEVTAWEIGRAEPGISRMRVLTEHVGVRDDQITLGPRESSSLVDRLMGWS